jgi:hypothetical protein
MQNYGQGKITEMKTDICNEIIYRHTMQNVHSVDVFLVECLLVFNIQTSQNVYISQYIFWLMLTQERFILLFAVPYHECNIYVKANKLHMLLHTKQLVVDNHINCLVTRKKCFQHFTSYHDGFTVFLLCFRELVGGFGFM